MTSIKNEVYTDLEEAAIKEREFERYVPSPEEIKYKQEMEALEREYHKLSLIGMCLESKLRIHELQAKLKEFEPKPKNPKQD